MSVVLPNPIGEEDITEPNFVDLLEEGWYDVDIHSSEQQTSASGYTYLKIVFEIVTPTELDGKKKNWFFGIYDGSEKGVAFNRALLGRIAKACGVDRLESTDQIEGKRVRLRIGKKDWNGSPQNSIKEVHKSVVVETKQTKARAVKKVQDDEIPF